MTNGKWKMRNGDSLVKLKRIVLVVCSFSVCHFPFTIFHFASAMGEPDG